MSDEPSTFDDGDFSLPGLWEAAKDIVRWLFSCYGRPVEIVARGPLTNKEYREISSWLAAAERIARRLLVVEAAALVKTLPAAKKRAASASPRTAARQKSVFAQDPEDATTWKVSFRVFIAKRRGGRNKLCSPAGELSRACATEGDCPNAGEGAASFASSALEPRGNPPQAAVRPAPPRGSRDDADALKGTGLRSAWPLAERIEAARRVLNDPAPYALRLARRLRGKPRLAAAIADPEGGSAQEKLGRWAFGHAIAQACEAVPAFDTS